MNTDVVELAVSGDEPPSPSSKSIQTVSLHFAEVNEHSSQHSALPPVDRGFAAWSFLVAAFLTDVLIWGFPSSSGILLATYLNDPVYSSQHGSASLLPLIGTLCTGIMYCSGLVIYPIIDYYPYMRRWFTCAGTLLCFCSLLGASFTTKVTTLVALQGVLFAVGGSLAYAPVVSYLSEWFVQRRGLANGIFFCGSGLAGIVLPIIFPPLIKKYGVMGTVRGYAVTLFIGMIPTLLFVKPRMPEPRIRGPNPRARSNYGWLKNKNLWFFIMINTVQGLGYFVPIIWLPTFGTSLGLTSAKGSLSLTLFNVFGNVSCFVVGYMSDKYDIWLLTLSSLVLSCLSTFVLWGICSYSLSGILAYSSIYGAVAGGFSSLWSASVRPIAKDDSSLSTTLVGYMFLTRGIGNIVSTPISTALQQARSIQSRSVHHTGFSVAGGRFQDMIIYTGTCFAGAAFITVLGWSLDRRYRSD